MMDTDAVAAAVDEALSMLPQRMDSIPARVMIYAIGLQESQFKYRRQMGNGPARGFWQFERGGGVVGVMKHAATSAHARNVCAERGVWFNRWSVWRALEVDDVLAAVFARLLLWSDPKPLPDLSDEAGAWNLYMRTWRPGQPHKHTWHANHSMAVDLVRVAV